MTSPPTPPAHSTGGGADFAGASFDAILKLAVARGASDIHVKAGDVIRVRVDGNLVPMGEKPLTVQQVRALAERVVGDGRLREGLDSIREHDCSYAVQDLGRFRANVLRQRGSVMLVLRAIPIEVPTFADLRLPAVIETLTRIERGLVVVTGMTGSGKSSTQAAMIEHLNQRVRKHVVTLENPIEFLFRDKLCSVTQREVGPDTDSFATGLRSAMRQDPDVILIGEMRDGETIDIALKAAETGHLVLSTLHTPDALSTIHRMLAAFPPQEQRSVRVRLAESLRAVISQRLLRARSGAGRVLACEVMVMTATIRDMIIAEHPLEEIRELMHEGGESYGSQTFDQHLEQLVREELVSYETALAASTNSADFGLRFRLGGRPAAATAAPGPLAGYDLAG
ncbi:MAG: PilT/PilU family type 4a pilus ATPase [Gemmatimonadetes bacterium]|nr:PilT/PilU family type 4a pilus ATPase [Gemmatimonadota bacterium]